MNTCGWGYMKCLMWLRREAIEPGSDAYDVLARLEDQCDVMAMDQDMVTDQMNALQGELEGLQEDMEDTRHLWEDLPSRGVVDILMRRISALAGKEGLSQREMVDEFSLRRTLAR